MTLTRKDSQGKDDGVLLDSSSPCPHVQSIMAVTDEQLVISSRLEVTESIDSQHPELLDIPSDFKRSHSVHLTGINHVLLREKPRMLSRPRYSYNIYRYRVLMFEVTFCCPGCHCHSTSHPVCIQSVLALVSVLRLVCPQNQIVTMIKSKTNIITTKARV